MLDLCIESLLIGWDRNLDYAKKLVADLSDEQMMLQPRPGMNHPAWTFSHMNIYHEVIAQLASGGTFPDPREHRFGMLSKPEAEASLYGTKQSIIGQYEQGHARVAEALRNTSAATLERPMPLERWKKLFPKAGSALGYLMLVHESTHLGQISAWRRVQGLASV